MSVLIRPTYRYTDPALTPPTPGAALVLEVGLVFSRPGVGPKGGGRHGGIPLAVGPTTTLLRRHDGTRLRLPNTDLLLWHTPFLMAGHRHGVVGLHHRPGWEWLDWTLADHVTHDHHTAAAAPAHGVTPVRAGQSSPLVIVGCGSRKRTGVGAVPAGALYLGTFHRLCQRAARRLAPVESIRILSGRFGLLPLDTVVAPYEMRVGEPGSVTADTVHAQASAQGLLDLEDVIVLAGRDYSRIVTAVWPQARTPPAGSANSSSASRASPPSATPPSIPVGRIRGRHDRNVWVPRDRFRHEQTAGVREGKAEWRPCFVSRTTPGERCRQGEGSSNLAEATVSRA
ncbi:DUF6884 domain-containing protein [Rhodococcus pseudokoreensis]|uniref:DUF6884 domain-containing protein n=1 Tax=Rhodococcus pseudokoreensis TaxID=2811421 RepID=UPI001F124333|nr:DUF6884 domain-containing protein [Rhodococcus pseudokoreensis]